MSSTAAEAEYEPVTAAPVQWVVFSCAGERFALPLERVREILTPLPFVRLPGATEEVCGLVGVRSRVVTAFDMGVVLGLSPSHLARDHRLLLVEYGDRTPAFVVEEVHAVTPVEVALAVSSDGGHATARDMILGSGEFENVPFHVLDMDRMLDRLLI
ncbi:MAG: chemotaxis protein CheW [Longimicrobiales bacterium]